MNIKAYIESGILESYVLGLANLKEIAEVEQMKAAHPEIKAEIHAIETALETYAFAHASTPPDGLEGQIWDKIQATELASNSSKIINFQENGRVHDTKMIDFQTGNEIVENQTSERKGFFSNYLSIAASVALLMSVLGNIYLLNKNTGMKETLSLAINENIELQKNAKTQEMMMPEEVNLMMDPTKKLCKLMGQKDSPNSTVMLAWDMQTNKVYLLRPNLPTPPKGKQYQLWAIMGDKPVDAGVFNVTMRMQELKTTTLPKAFAVTLENMGGSEKPTSNIYAMGL